MLLKEKETQQKFNYWIVIYHRLLQSNITICEKKKRLFSIIMGFLCDYQGRLLLQNGIEILFLEFSTSNNMEI